MDQRVSTVWQQNFSVGNAVLDNQHKRLLHLCDKAIYCLDLEDRSSAAEFHLILNDLSGYVTEHFRTEERLLSHFNYPLVEKHKEEHDAYNARLIEFLFAATLGNIDKNGLSRYLREWWAEHILCSDKQFSWFIKGVRH